jgi:hypothetical protein
MLCQLLPGVVEGVCPSEALPRNGLHLSTVAVPRRQERLHKHKDNHRVRTPSPLHFPFPFYLHTALAYPHATHGDTDSSCLRVAATLVITHHHKEFHAHACRDVRVEL